LKLRQAAEGKIRKNREKQKTNYWNQLLVIVGNYCFSCVAVCNARAKKNIIVSAPAPPSEAWKNNNYQ
jgi:hypothetical protein